MSVEGGWKVTPKKNVDKGILVTGPKCGWSKLIYSSEKVYEIRDFWGEFLDFLSGNCTGFYFI